MSDRFLHFSRPLRSLISLPAASKTWTFATFSSVSASFGSCSTALTAASRFLSGKVTAAAGAREAAIRSPANETTDRERNVTRFIDGFSSNMCKTFARKLDLSDGTRFDRAHGGKFLTCPGRPGTLKTCGHKK